MTLRFPIAPMLATHAARLPVGDDWAFEIKWDGYRNLVFLDRTNTDAPLRVQARSGLDATTQFVDDLVSITDSLNATSAILDGEIVALDDDGRPDFGALQRRDRPVAFYAFDVLQIDGTDTITLRYTDRRRLLESLLEPGPSHLVPSYRVGNGEELAAITETQGLEGVVAKRLDSAYLVGSRSKSWLKVKHRRRLEVTIGGYTTGSGTRRQHFGSLLVGIPQTDGTLRFVGRIGTGFNERTLADLGAALAELTTAECPFGPPPPSKYGREACWVDPRLVALVEMADFSDDGVIRQGSFVGLVG